MTIPASYEVQVVRAAWAEYTRPRWSAKKSQELWHKLSLEVCATWKAHVVAAQSCGGRLRFGKLELGAAVIRGLESACEYCGELYGVESWGVVRRNPLRGVRGANVADTDFSIGAMAVCCRQCSLAHRMFTDAEYLDVLAALRRCDAAVTAAAVDALAKGTPWALRPASNAKRAAIR